MERLSLDGVELAYRVVGQGEPVLLIHAAVLADFFAPLQDMPALTDRYQVITYHRVGYGASSRASGPVEVTEQADHGRALLDALGLGRAHVVGHSSGGLIALQLALQSPATVGSLALLEPSLSGPSSASLAERVIGPMFQRYTSGDKAGAIDTFLAGVCGADYREVVERMLPPGAMEQAVADADTFIGVEAPSVGRWVFGADEASRVGQPVLVVTGEQSWTVSPGADEAAEQLSRWFPGAESYPLPHATHLLQLQNPADLADALAAFFARHPLS